MKTHSANDLLLTTHQLAVGRDDHRLQSAINLAIEIGNIWQITGKNGCGKSSLLDTLAGLLPPLKGQIHYHIPRRELFHYCRQQTALKNFLSVRENLTLLLALHQQKCVKPIEKWAETVGMTPFLDKPLFRLSQGQQKQTTLARLMILPPRPLWLLDEPFNGLDANARLAWLNRIQQHRATGAVVLISHESLLSIGTHHLALGEVA